MSVQLTFNFQETPNSFKIALHSSISQMALKEGIQITPEALLAIVEIVFEQGKLFGFDLAAFSNHAKRATINADDVRLLLRRHPAMAKDLEDD